MRSRQSRGGRPSARARFVNVSRFRKRPGLLSLERLEDRCLMTVGGPPSPPGSLDTGFNPPDCDPCQCDCDAATGALPDDLKVQLADGNVSHAWAGTRYDSRNNPHPIVSFEMQSSGAASMKLWLSANGLGQVPVFYNTSTYTGSQLLRGTLLLDATGLATGRHSVTIHWQSFAAGGTMISSGSEIRSMDIVNRFDSPFGRGRWIDDLDQLHFAGSDVLLVRGDGTTAWFRQQGPGQYAVPLGRYASLAPDMAAGPGGFRLTHADGVYDLFRADGTISKKVDLNGNARTYTFSGGRLVSRVDENGLATTFGYSQGKLVWTSDWAGRFTSYSVAAGPGGALQAVTSPDPDGAGPQAAQVVSFSYQVSGLLQSVAEPGGRTTTFEYDAGRGIRKITQADGSVRWLQSALSRRVVDLAVTGYDAAHLASPDHLGLFAEPLLTEMTDERGYRTTYEVNPWGQPLRVTNPLNEVTVYSRDANGHLTGMSADPDGPGPAHAHQTTYVVDEFGNRLQATYPTTPVTRETWVYGSPFHRLLQHTDELGRMTKYSRSVLTGNLLSIRRVVGQEDSAGNYEFNDQVTRFTWTADGQLQTETDALGRMTTYQYFPKAANSPSSRRLQSVMQAAGTPQASTTSYVYSLNLIERSTTVATIDGLGQRTEVTTDALGREVLRREADPTHPGLATGPAWRFEYDGRGNRTRVTDPLLRVAGFQWDVMNRLIQRTDPDPDASGPLPPAVTQSSYWPTGQLKASTDSLGRVTNYDYDPLGRPIRVSRPSPDGSPESQVTYDGFGQMVSTRDPLGWVTDYEYDVRGRLVRVIEPSPDGFAPRPVTEYTLDAAGQRIGRKDALGNSWAYQYDPLGRLILEIQPDPDGAAGPQTAPVMSYRHDLVGNLLSVSDPRGVTVQHEYDPRNRAVAMLQPLADPAAVPFQAVVDDSSPGTSRVGQWYAYAHGYGDTRNVSYSASQSSTFTWNISGLGLGKQYEVLVTWNPTSSVMGTSQYSVQHGTTTLAQATVDQRFPAGDLVDDAGRTWERIAVIDSAPSASLSVVLTAPLYGVADAVQVRELGGTTRVSFDAASQVTSVTNARGFTTTMSYDGLGRRTRVLDPAGQLSRFDYDLVGNLTAVHDPRQIQHQLQFRNTNPLNVLDVNANGVIDPADANTVISYLQSGNLPSAEFPYVDVNGNGVIDPQDSLLVINQLGTDTVWPTVTVFRHDGLDRLARRIEPLPSYYYDGRESSVTSYAYDAAGRMMSWTDPLGRTTRLGYDQLDRQVTKAGVDPDGPGPLVEPVESTAYDLLGRVVARQDARNQTTTYAYDRLGRMTSLSDPMAGVTAMTYDAVGNRLSLRDALNQVTRWTYDGLNRLASEVDPLGKTRTYVRDPLGQVIRLVDRRGLERRWVYDLWNRLTAEDWHAAATGPATAGYRFAYDPVGNVTMASGVGGLASSLSYDYTHDNVDRLATETVSGLGFSSAGTAANRPVLTHQYDMNGQRTRLIGRIGLVGDFRNTYAYDRMGRMMVVQQIQHSAASAVAAKWFGFSYDADSALTRVQRVDGPGPSYGPLIGTSDYTYNQAGWMNAITHKNAAGTPIAGYAWTHDQAGRMTSYVPTQVPSETAFSLVHDNRNQLTAVDRSGTAGDESYSYNATGNRTSGGFVPAANNRYATVNLGGLSYATTYDDEGNLTRLAQGANTIDYVYDHRNRLTSVTYRTSGAITRIAAYTYDAWDRRIRKIVDSDGAGPQLQSTAIRVFDGQNPVLEFNAYNSLSRRYLHGGAVDQVLAAENLTPAGGFNWLPSAPGSVLLPLTDQIHSVRDLIDTAGTVRNHVNYDLMGQVKGESNPGVDFLYGFAGMERDEETGNTRSDTRYYQPGLGRWLTEDPLGLAAGDVNLVRYVGNAPALAVDPSGLKVYGIGGTWERAEDNALVRQFVKLTREPAQYWSGTGSDDGWLVPYVNGAVGASNSQIVDSVYRQIRFDLKQDPHGTVNLVGWSRGAVAAAAVARRLDSVGIEVNWVGLFDPVSQHFRPGWSNGRSMRIPANVKHVAVEYHTRKSIVENTVYPSQHIVLSDPCYTSATFQSIKNADGTRTKHSQVGGKNSNNDALQWMVDRAQDAGVEVSDLAN